MEPLEWNQALAIGHPEIDGQHRELFDRANQFFAVVAERERQTEIALAFRYLDTYVRFHFAREEKLMRGLRYPGLAEHREEHREYIRRLDSVKSQFESEGDSTAVALALDGLLRLWLLQHVAEADRRVSAYLSDSPGH